MLRVGMKLEVVHIELWLNVNAGWYSSCPEGSWVLEAIFQSATLRNKVSKHLRTKGPSKETFSWFESGVNQSFASGKWL